MPRCVPRRRQTGFTLVELLVVISVAAILAMIAVPSLRATLQKNELDTVTNQLVASLANARSEALRTPDAHICIYNPNASNAQSWALGWMQVTQTPTCLSSPAAPDATATVLKSPAGLPGPVSVLGTAVGVSVGSATAPVGFSGPIGFNGMGRLVATASNPQPTLTFVICADATQPPVNQSRAVIVSPSGRASIAHIGKSGANLGLPLDDTGNAITSSCTAP